MALRVEAAGPLSTEADVAGEAVFAEERAELLPVAVVADWVACGAVELLNTAPLLVLVTPAVEPLTRAVTGLRVAVDDGVRAVDGVRWVCVERCGRAAGLDWATAPLVVADAERAGAGADACGCVVADAAGAVAGAGAAVAAAGPALGAEGVGDAAGAVADDAVDAGGAVGVAGVP